MKIRELKADELQSVVHLGHEFAAEAKPPGGRFAEAHWLASWAALLAGGDAVLLAATEHGEAIGALGGAVTRDLNTAILFGAELFWYVTADARTTGAGRELLAAFEAWARERGAEYVLMITIEACSPIQMGRMYEGLGYQKLETYFMKALA